MPHVNRGRLLRLLPLGLLATALAAPTLGADAEPADVDVKVKEKEAIEFRCGKELVGTYYIADAVAKPYLWPLNAPGGLTVTRAWPMVKPPPADEKSTDHVHQKSLWFCHGDVIPEGVEVKNKSKNVEGVDFWMEEKGAGRIVCTKVGKVEQKGSHGKVATTNEWLTADGDKILEETRTIHLYNLGKAWLLVFDIDLNATVCPITFGDTKEGSFGVRVRDSVTEEKGKGHLTNADGKVGEKNGVWGHVSDWCDYSGPVEGKTAGVAIFADPTNPGPTCWHSRGYGLMAANPFGRDKSGFPAMKGKTDLVKLAKGAHLKLRYGVLLHDGDPKEADVAGYYKQFVKLKD
jgi:Methane oxygenase PmoA